MSSIQHSATHHQTLTPAGTPHPKFAVGRVYKLRCYPDRTLEISDMQWAGRWEYGSTWNGEFVCWRSEADLDAMMLPEVAPGQCAVVAGYTSTHAIAISGASAFNVVRRLRGEPHRYEGFPGAELMKLMDPHVKAYFDSLPIPRSFPVAEYEIGCCYYGAKTAYKTVKIPAWSKEKAMEEARKLLTPNTVEHLILVATAPNPEHVEYMNSLRATALSV